jgi:cytochrome c peroxidase
MRRIATGPSAVDRYLDGEREALDPAARVGLREFVRSGCPTCHFGPSLSDGAYHQIGSEMVDRGRAQGIETLLASPFSSAGPHYDADAGEALPLPMGPSEADEHAFRTPSLRNVGLTAPYGHAGMHAGLNDILTPDGMMGTSHDERIEPFLLALTGAADPAWATAP